MSSLLFVLGFVVLMVVVAYVSYRCGRTDERLEAAALHAQKVLARAIKELRNER